MLIESGHMVICVFGFCEVILGQVAHNSTTTVCVWTSARLTRPNLHHMSRNYYHSLGLWTTHRLLVYFRAALSCLYPLILFLLFPRILGTWQNYAQVHIRNESEHSSENTCYSSLSEGCVKGFNPFVV